MEKFQRKNRLNDCDYDYDFKEWVDCWQEISKLKKANSLLSPFVNGIIRKWLCYFHCGGQMIAWVYGHVVMTQVLQRNSLTKVFIRAGNERWWVHQMAYDSQILHADW